jgi:hypothetical protein
MIKKERPRNKPKKNLSDKWLEKEMPEKIRVKKPKRRRL